MENTKDDENYDGSHNCPVIYWVLNIWHVRHRNDTRAKICSGQWQGSIELHLCYPSAQFLMEETQEAALGDSGWSREGRRLWCPWPGKENSLGALHRMKGWPCSVGSLLQPSAPWVRLFFHSKKGRDRKGLEMPPNGCLSHYTTSAAVVRPILSTMVGAVWKVQATSSPRRGGRWRRALYWSSFLWLQRATRYSPLCWEESNPLCFGENREPVLKLSQPRATQQGFPPHHPDHNPSQIHPLGMVTMVIALATKPGDSLSRWPQSSHLLKK